MKKFCTAIAALWLVASSQVFADDYQYLTITETGGDTQVAISAIDKITFDNNDMILNLTDGNTQRLPLAGLSKMFFSDGSQGIATISESKSKIQMYDGQLKVNLAKGEHVTLYNVKGEAVYTSKADATIDLKTLSRGVYIVRVGSEAKKFINR